MTKQHQKWWTAAERDLLEKLRADNYDWETISARCGHTIGSCKTTLSNIQARRAAQAAGKIVKAPRAKQRAWTEEECARLLHLKEVEKKTWREIDALLGRRKGTSHSKYIAIRDPLPVSMIEPANRVVLSEKALAERAARQRLEHQSLTAAFCGDPLPGYSALDQKRDGASTEKPHAV